jgi:hypothetical protein
MVFYGISRSREQKKTLLVLGPMRLQASTVALRPPFGVLCCTADEIFNNTIFK